MEKVIVVGAGGHSRVVVSMLECLDQYEIVGVADKNTDCFDEQILSTTIRYSWDELSVLFESGIRSAVIAIGDNNERKKIYLKLKNVGFLIPNIIHPSSFLEKKICLSDGNHICIGVKIATSVNIGHNNIINTGSLLDHEVRVGNNVFIAPGCCIAGRVTIGDDTFIGIGVSIVENIKIGKNVVIGAGSVVLENIPDNVTFAGVPAKKIF